MGKGISGVRNINAKSPVKILDLEAENGNKVCFDFSSSLGQLIDQKGKIEHSFKLGEKPYEVLMESVAQGTYIEDRLCLNIERAKRILEVIEDMRWPIPRCKDDIPTYSLGMHQGDPAPYLEDLLDGGRQALPVLYGR